MTRARHLKLVPPLPGPRRDETHALRVTGLLARSGALGAEPLRWAARRERAGVVARDVYVRDRWEALEDLKEHRSTMREPDVE